MKTPFHNQTFNLIKKMAKTKLLILLTLCFWMFGNAQSIAPQTYEPYFPVFKDGKMGYINKSGEIMININLYQPDYYKINNWTGNYVVVQGEDKCAIYDRNAKQVLPNTYDDIAIDEDNKLIKVSNKTSEYSFSSYVGFFNFEGKEVIPVKYESSLFGGYKFYDGLWQFEEKMLKGYLNMKGEIAIQPKYDWANDFSNGFAVAKLQKDGLYGVINTKGEWVIQPAYTSIGSFDKQGLAIAIKSTNKLEHIIINTKGLKIASLKNLRPKVEFMSGNNFDEFGLCRVFDTITKKVGFINQQGKIVIPIEYDYLSNFSKERLATANKGGVLNDATYFKEIEYGNWTLINTQGVQQFTPINAQKMNAISEGMVSFKKGGYWGFMNEKGDQIITPTYTQQPDYFTNGLCRIKGEPIKKENSFFSKTPFGYIDKTGKVIWEIQL